MAPLLVPGAALVRLIWTLGGTPYAVNVIGTRKTGAPVIDQGFANSVGAAIKASFTGSPLIGQLGSAVALASVGTRDISTGNNVEFIDSAAAVAGSGAGNLLPLQVAYCITLRTAKAGKSFRGRYYQPGFEVGANLAGGTVSSGTRDAAVAFLNDVRTDLPAVGLTMAVVSRKLLTTEIVTSVQGRDLIWDTIRGRANPGI